MPRITYSEDFKHEAVRLVTNEGYFRKQVTRDLGISAASLRDWIHRHAPEGLSYPTSFRRPNRYVNSSANCPRLSCRFIDSIAE